MASFLHFIIYPFYTFWARTHIFRPREFIFWQILAIVRRSVCQNIYDRAYSYSFLSNHKKLSFFTSQFDSMFALKNFNVPFLYSFSKKFESIPVCWSSKTRKKWNGTHPNFQSKMGAKKKLHFPRYSFGTHFRLKIRASATSSFCCFWQSANWNWFKLFAEGV